MCRVVAYVDGFNLYHAIRRLKNPRLKWCDVRKLILSCLEKKEAMSAVRLYTAFPGHCGLSVQNRFNKYMKALEATGVEIIYGKFKEKHRTVKVENADKTRKVILHYRQSEEKQTDVNLATDLVEGACENKYDKAVIVSGDSDFLRVVERVLKKNKEILLLMPPFQKCRDIRKMGSGYKNFWSQSIKAKRIEKALFPERIPVPGGRDVVMPAEYARRQPVKAK